MEYFTYISNSYFGNDLIPVFCALSGFWYTFVFLLFVLYHIFSCQILPETSILLAYFQELHFCLFTYVTISLAAWLRYNWYLKSYIYLTYTIFMSLDICICPWTINIIKLVNLSITSQFPCASLFLFVFMARILNMWPILRHIFLHV